MLVHYAIYIVLQQLFRSRMIPIQRTLRHQLDMDPLAVSMRKIAGNNYSNIFYNIAKIMSKY